VRASWEEVTLSRQLPLGAMPSGWRDPARGRRPTEAVCLLAAMAMVLMTAVSCSADRGSLDRGSSSRPGSTLTASGPTGFTSAPPSGSQSPVSTTPPAAATVAGDGTPRFAVGTVVRDFSDPSRQRVLHTIVHFPAKGRPAQAGTEPAGGAFPLVLMAHGFRLPAAGYERLLGTVTAAGYIVAAPAFPHTSAERGDGNRADIVNQPADLSFLVDAVTSLAKQQPQLLPPVADPARVAALGHSDGGLTVSAWAYDNSFRDRRVAAVVVMAGGIGLFPSTYFAPDSPPLLAIHATADQTNPYSASVSLFNAVPAGIPHFLLTIEGGSHLGPYMYDTAMPEVGRVIVDFLDGYFLKDADARQRLPTDADHPGITTLHSKA
jgi:dienelactone hydrolase